MIFYFVFSLYHDKINLRVYLYPTVKDQICWWRQNIQNSSRKMILAQTVDYTKHTDGSNLLWGAHYEDQTINGRWSDSEKTLHINCLELLATKLAIKSVLLHKVPVMHLRTMSDKSTAIAYINTCICCSYTWQAEFISRH